jgi:hypothetical protein
MPLSRFTHTFPLDFAEEMSGSDASPERAALLAFFAGAGADELVAGALGAELAGIDDLLDPEVAGAVAGAEPAALASSDDFFWRLFLGEAVASEPEAAAAV